MVKWFSYTVIIFLLASCSIKETARGKILIITSNQHTYGDTKMNTSNHFAEIVLAYDVFIKNGFKVDFLSPLGGAIPIGYIKTSDPIQKKYIYDSEFMHLLKTTKSPSEINAADYAAVYYSGGGAAMFGVADNEDIQALVEQVYAQNGVVSAVCHGTAGLVYLQDEHGNPLYQNKKISGYPDLFERKNAAYFKTFPFSIEEAVRKHNGNFVYSETPRSNFFIVDGRFITGQDPSASASVAQQVVSTLKNN